MRTLNYKTRFIDLASEINTQMPAYVVEKVAQALNEDRKAVNGSRVLVVGVAYKPDIDDIRESPALDVMRLLEQHGAEVVFHDPHISSFREDGHSHSGVQLTPAELQRADAVVIVTNHRAIDYQMLMDHATVIVDSRNAMSRTVKTRARVVSLANTRSAAAGVGTEL
jgi:UDP-N-acetyl-D-glucosamine dehydrogenase